MSCGDEPSDELKKALAKAKTNQSLPDNLLHFYYGENNPTTEDLRRILSDSDYGFKWGEGTVMELRQSGIQEWMEFPVTKNYITPDNDITKELVCLWKKAKEDYNKHKGNLEKVKYPLQDLRAKRFADFKKLYADISNVLYTEDGLSIIETEGLQDKMAEAEDLIGSASNTGPFILELLEQANKSFKYAKPDSKIKKILAEYRNYKLPMNGGARKSKKSRRNKRKVSKRRK